MNNTLTENGDIVTYDFRCDEEVAISKQLQVFRGEAIRIIASLYDNNTKQLLSGTASFYWQTKEMEEQNQWWVKSATINEDGDIEVIFDSKTQDDGSDSYTWFFGIETGSGLNTRAHGIIVMQHGIGTPNELPLPTPRIDFATVEVVNPPWVPLISAEVLARISADNELSGMIDDALSAISAEARARASADTALNNSINQATTIISSHVNDTTIHVTSADKTKWNGAVSELSDKISKSVSGWQYMKSNLRLQATNDALVDLYPAGLIGIRNLSGELVMSPSGISFISGANILNFILPTQSGRLALTTDIPAITSKVDKVPSAISGDIATFNASGNIVDSGFKPSSFAKTTDLPGFETWTFEVEISGTTQTVTKKVAIYPQQ